MFSSIPYSTPVSMFLIERLGKTSGLLSHWIPWNFQYKYSLVQYGPYKYSMDPTSTVWTLPTTDKYHVPYKYSMGPTGTAWAGPINTVLSY